MLSNEAYEFGSVIVAGECTVHSLVNSVAKEEFEAEDLIPSLHNGLVELVKCNLINWYVWEEKYGEGDPIHPENQSDPDLFNKYWDYIFSDKTSSNDFMHSENTLSDIFEPTISIEPTDSLNNELGLHDQA